ncbi:MAG: GntR family transcriptional regulator [Clostridia bacterium]|nr:GntR family transcriptional regulator [Clostridia bacterium]
MAEKLYQKIYGDLLDGIESGSYPAGSRLPTEHALMAQYGVSRITAIKALNLLRENGYIERRPKVGSVVRSFSPAAGSLGNIHFLTVGSNNSVPGLYEAICDEAALLGMGVVMYNSHHSGEAEREHLRAIRERKVPGVICYPLNAEMESVSEYAELVRAGIPLVSVDKRIRSPGAVIPCVTTDNRKAMYDLTSWLIETMGHRRIAYCCALLSQANARYRQRGYTDALITHGLAFDAALVDALECRVMPYRANRMEYELFLSHLVNLPDPPTAIVCECDYVAFQVMRSARTLGIAIPETLSVAGFDNVDMSDMLDVPLTTMKQDFSRIGRAAVRQLYALMNGGAAEPLTLFDAELVIRASVNRK